MENYKRIAKDIRLHHLMKAIVYTVIVSALIFAVMVATKQYSQLWIGLAVTAGVLVLFSIIALVSAGISCGRIRHRIKACSGTVSLENETFTPCAKELSYGSEWLVYHHDNTYLFWTKKNIHQIKVLGEKRNSYTLAVYSTLHPEGEAVTCRGNRESLASLNAWYHSEM